MAAAASPNALSGTVECGAAAVRVRVAGSGRLQEAYSLWARMAQDESDGSGRMLGTSRMMSVAWLGSGGLWRESVAWAEHVAGSCPGWFAGARELLSVGGLWLWGMKAAILVGSSAVAGAGFGFYGEFSNQGVWNWRLLWPWGCATQRRVDLAGDAVDIAERIHREVVSRIYGACAGSRGMLGERDANFVACRGGRRRAAGH